METTNIHEAKTNLSRLLKRVARGEEVIISRAGKPVAKLVPVVPATSRQPGFARGRFTLPDSFFEDLPEATLKDWEK